MNSVILNPDFGYSPHNLRELLKGQNISQTEAREVIKKSRNTFSRYLYDIDHPNHVSMTYSDWVALLNYVNHVRKTARVKLNSDITIKEDESGFQIKIPQTLEDSFKKVFPSVEWKPLSRAWHLKKEFEKQLFSWVTLNEVKDANNIQSDSQKIEISIHTTDI